MINITFKNRQISLTHMMIYKSNYSNMLQSHLEAFADNVSSLEDFDKALDKSSRLANINSVKLLNNKEALKTFKNYMNDLDFMDSLYNKEDLVIDIEEQQGNKYHVTVMHKQYDYILDDMIIYAPNYDTALERANLLIRYKLPKEL